MAVGGFVCATRFLVFLLTFALMLESKIERNIRYLYRGEDIVTLYVGNELNALRSFDHGKNLSVKSSPVSAPMKAKVVLNMTKIFLLSHLVVLAGDVSTNPGPCYPTNGNYKRTETRGLAVAHLNVRGIRSAIDELR